MKNEPIISLQPAVIEWARKSIGISVEEVAHKIKRPVKEVRAWELGDSYPTYSQLEKLAYKVFKRPLAIFFLPEPPNETPPSKEFRTLPSSDLLTLQSDTHVQIRKAHAYQLTLKDVFIGRNPSQKCIWRELSLDVQQPIEPQATLVRELLNISLQCQIEWGNDETALKQWRKSIENLGIFVFKSSFKQKEISGFCLSDPEFPLIYLNNSTTKTRQIFSLLHELSHLLLSVNGISKINESYIDRLPHHEKKIEQFCNKIASEILIPSIDFRNQTEGLANTIESSSDDVFVRLASRYGVSREAVLRRFFDNGKVSQEFYEQKARFWSGQKKNVSGGDWYASQNAYLSGKFAQEVVSQHYRKQLTVEQASDFLGINGKNFYALEQRILEGAAA